MQQLIQQNGFHSRAFVLREDDVYVHTKDFQQEREYSVDYLDLGLQFYRKSEHKHRLWKWLAAATFGLCSVALFLTGIGAFTLSGDLLFILASLSGAVWLSTSLKQSPTILYLLGGEEQLSFLNDEPNEDDLHDFLEELTDKIKDAYQDRYLNEKSDVPKDERRSRIQWLHQMKVLTRTEKDVLLAKLGPPQNAIGFKRTA